MKIACLTILTMLFLTACTAQEVTPSSDPRDKLGPQHTSITDKIKPKNAKMLTIRGTVVYKNLEGGFWGFNDTNGKAYTPFGLKPEFRRHGLVVEIVGQIDNEIMTINQYGPVFKIKSLKIIDDSNVVDNTR